MSENTKNSERKKYHIAKEKLSDICNTKTQQSRHADSTN